MVHLWLSPCKILFCILYYSYLLFLILCSPHQYHGWFQLFTKFIGTNYQCIILAYLLYIISLFSFRLYLLTFKIEPQIPDKITHVLWSLDGDTILHCQHWYYHLFVYFALPWFTSYHTRELFYSVISITLFSDPNYFYHHLTLFFSFSYHLLCFLYYKVTCLHIRNACSAIADFYSFVFTRFFLVAHIIFVNFHPSL